jgi:hypothetical protein
MVTETLVKEALGSEMIVAGADLIARLDKAGFSVFAAFWFYVPESETWRLIIASPEVRLDGPKKAYKKIQSVLARMPIEMRRIALNEITVIDSKDPFISSLKTGIQTDKGISGIRLIKTAINGLFIEDAYIYRMI